MRPISPPSRSLRGAALWAALLLGGAAAGCKNSPRASDSGAAKGDAAPTPGAEGSYVQGMTPEQLKTRDQRFFRVDALIAQWDAAQRDGRDDVAAGLAAKVAEETEADFATFQAAARGEVTVAAQNLAVKALGFSKNPRATDLLVERLQGNDAALVGNALISLKIRSDPATPLRPILRLLRVEAIEARRYAPLALANIVLARERARLPVDAADAEEAMTGLVGLVQDHDPYARLHTAKAMGALRRPEAVDFLILLLRDEHVEIRIAGAAALERIGDPRAFPQVVDLMAAVDAKQKPVVAEILASYAERVQGAPLSAEEKASFGTSPIAWNRWFSLRSQK